MNTASDIYSLGVLLYELLTGRLPFDWDTVSEEVMRRDICEATPPKPSSVIYRESSVAGGDRRKQRRALANDVDNIVMKALSKPAERRYASVEQFSADIERHLRGFPVLAKRPSALYLARKLLTRHRLASAIACLILLLFLGFLASLVVQQRQTARERDKAEQLAAFLVGVFERSDPRKAIPGEEITARELLDNAAAKIEKEPDLAPQIRATMMHTIGWVYAELGYYDKARPLLERALAIRGRGKNKADLAESHAKTGYLHFWMGLYETAEAHLKAALEIQEARLGRNHRQVADIYVDLAAVYRITDRGKEAETVARKALAMKEASPQAKPLPLAKSMTILADTLSDQSRYDEALPLYRRALNLTQSVLGENHMTYSSILTHYALALMEIGQLEKAEGLLCRALEIDEKALGRQHPGITSALNNLGLVNDYLEHNDEAASYYQRALEIREKALGPEHPNLAVVLNNLADSLRIMGRYDEAEAFYARSIGILESVDPHHSKLGRLLGGLGRVYLDRQNFDLAAIYLNQAFEITSQANGIHHRDSAFELYYLAKMYRLQEHHEMAASLYEQVLAVNEQIMDPQDPGFIAVLTSLATSYLAMGKTELCEPLLQRALAIAEGVFGPQSLKAALCLHLLAELRAAEGHQERALNLCDQAKKLREQGDDSRLADSLELKARILRNLKRDSRALPLERRAAVLRKEIR